MASKNLSDITDLTTLSKILPGITASDLATIKTNYVAPTIVNLLNASLTYSVPLNSIQV